MQIFLSAPQAESRQLDYTAFVFKCMIKQFYLLNKARFIWLFGVFFSQKRI